MEGAIEPRSATWNPALRPDSDADLLGDGGDWTDESNASSRGKAENMISSEQGSPQIPQQKIVNGNVLEKEVHEAVANKPERDGQAELETFGANYDEPQSFSKGPLTPPNLAKPSSLGAEADVRDAWGFDSDFQSPSYTNSFPPVPPHTTASQTTAVHPLSHSQVGNLMQEEVDSQKGTPGDDHWNSESWPPQQEEQHGDTDFFSKTQNNGEEPRTPPDDEARFEEGLPLVPTAEPETEPNEQPIIEPAIDPFSSTTEVEESNNFFSQLDNHNPAEGSEIPMHLERKSTEQVLYSISLASSTSQCSEKLMDAIYEHQTSQELKDVGLKPPDQPPNAPEGKSIPKDDDLAAMWQAALGDDELLDDEVDPGAFFGNDNEDFLEDKSNTATFSNLTSQPVPPQYAPQPPQPPQQTFQNNALGGAIMQSPYLPNNYTGQPSTGFNYSQSSFTTQHTRPAIVERAQSFADKSKGGYTSPYDAPMDLSRPKRQLPARNMPMIGKGTPAPPPPAPPPRRSDSLQSNSSGTSYLNQQPQVGSPALSQDTSMYTPNPSTGAPNSAVSGSQSRPNPSAFFEELPIVPKTRAPSFGHVAQQMPQPGPPPVGFPRPQQTQAPPPPPNALPIAPAQQTNHYGLVGPERVMPFSDSPPPPPTQQPSSSSAAGRYSPGPQNAPNQQSQPSGAASKYGTGASAQIPRAPSVPRQYTPHRPSPLARSASVSQQYQPRDRVLEPANVANETATNDRRPSMKTAQTYTPDVPPNPVASHMRPSREHTYHHPLEQNQIASPDTRTFDSHGSIQPQPSELQQNGSDFDLLGRPQVQPPGQLSGQISSQILEPSSKLQQIARQNVVRTRTSSTNTEASFIPPEDGRELDPLKRWQGAPILCWGFGGTIMTSFPQRTPRYAAGQRTPLIKCGPGGIKIRSTKILSPDEMVATFPGPLKSKGKKKEVLEWLQNSVGRLEQQYAQAPADPSLADVRKRLEERVILYKVLGVFVEHDGAFDSNLNAGQTIRNLLSPELAFEGSGEQVPPESISPIQGRGSMEVDTRTPVTTRSDGLEQLRKLLLKGERENAVWHAVDQKLWGHAMILASTLPSEVGKQVAQDFVRHEVKPAGKNTESIAALYDIFSGSWEESIDHLVPPSARAGFQMMSRNASASPATNGLAGLDRWRETLSLILSNRSQDDPKALVALGQLLARYGRYEAAHICYLFSKIPGLFGGADDLQISVVLLGADHRQQPFDYAKDFDSILLTEIYEFIYSILNSSSPGFTLPHLQAFKLYHAEILAEQGLREEAQQYCDVIGAALKGTTKISPYFHPRLFAALDEMNVRLQQSPKEVSGSWISRPSMEKVSGSMWNRFTQFVAGDDGDDSSVASGQAGTEGPFARINGGTPPTISRGPSPAGGVYIPYATGTVPPSGAPAINSTVVSSRYAPSAAGSNYAPPPSERPNPGAQGHGLLQGAVPDVLRLQVHQPPQPATAMYNSDSDRSLPTPPTLSKYSPEIGTHKSYNAIPPSRIQETQMSPPSSDAGNSRPSTGQGALSAPRDSMLSPNETRNNAYQPSPASDRYSPGYGPRSASSYGPRSASLEPKSAVYEPMSATSQPRSYMPSPSSESAPIRQSDTYVPSAPIYAEEPAEAPLAATSDIPAQSISDDIPLSSEEKPISYGYEPPSVSGHEPPTSSGYQPVSAGYEPATSSDYAPPSAGYEPPSYDAESTGDLTSPKSPKKKKSFVDLSDGEDNLAIRSAALKKKEKAAKDREADDAFRRAAEADAQHDKAGKSSGGGWLGGWFGGGKNKLDLAKQETKAHQIKFGEENSFYYDKDLKKWVNKKAGADAAGPSAPTPPPPKGGPPSRAVSAALPPNMPRPPPAAPTPPMGSLPGSSGPPSRNASPAIGALASPSNTGPEPAAPSPPTASASGSGASAIPAGLAPPSRPGTGMSGISNASSIDDLLGAPQARKGGTVKKNKKGRGYVDVMANKS